VQNFFVSINKCEKNSNNTLCKFKKFYLLEIALPLIKGLQSLQSVALTVITLSIELVIKVCSLLSSLVVIIPSIIEQIWSKLSTLLNQIPIVGPVVSAFVLGIINILISSFGFIYSATSLISLIIYTLIKFGITMTTLFFTGFISNIIFIFISIFFSSKISRNFTIISCF
jgi:hypothetical protein